MSRLKLFIALFVIVAFFLMGVRGYNSGYTHGYSQAEMHYEKQLSKQKSQFIEKRDALENQLTSVNKQIAEKANQVHQVFVPVEKEIIKYVSRKPNDNDKCGVDVSRWMQLHNDSANPFAMQGGAELNDLTPKAVRTN